MSLETHYSLINTTAHLVLSSLEVILTGILPPGPAIVTARSPSPADVVSTSKLLSTPTLGKSDVINCAGILGCTGSLKKTGVKPILKLIK